MITHYEHRAKFYSPIEQMINPGFISLTWEYQGHKIILRTLYPSDYRFLQEQPDSGLTWSSSLLAVSTYSVGGRRIVDPSYEAFDELVEFYQNLPAYAHQHLLLMVFTLAKRVRDAFKSLESFLYENRSREIWRYVGSYPSPVCDEFIGIPGLSKFGPNAIQQLWTIWNRGEDLREQYQVQWGFTKAMLSGLSPKGVKAVDAKDSAKTKAENRRRELVQAKWLFDILDIRYQGGDTLYKRPEMKTFEDLQEEGRKWLAGEKDFHDLVVEDYRRKIENRVAEVRSQQREREEEILADVEYGAGLVAYTPEEMKGLVKGISGIRKISEINPDLQEKWLSPAYTGNKG